MRTVIGVTGIIAVGLLVAARVVEWRVEVPPVAPSVERVCVDTMRQKPPDLSWVAPGRDTKIGAEHDIKTVTLGELFGQPGKLVRVAAVLHAENEIIGLYPSRAAMTDPL
jgi:hypothetical protein